MLEASSAYPYLVFLFFLPEKGKSYFSAFNHQAGPCDEFLEKYYEKIEYVLSLPGQSISLLL